MKRLLIITLAIIIFVPLAVVTWMTLFFDANDYREQMANGFKKATGREISIAGELNTSFFPWIGIQTGAIAIANAPGFGDAPLAGIRGAKIKLKLIPLFNGEVQMETVVLEGVQANLVTLKNGKTNWDFGTTEAATGSTETEASPGDNRKVLAALAIGGIEMKNASITWDDRQSGTKLELTNMDLETGAIIFDTPIAVSFSTNFAVNGEEMTGSMQARTDLKLASDLQSLKLNNFAINVDATGTALDGGILQKSMKGDIIVDLATQLVSSDKIALNLKLSGGIAPINPMTVTLESPLKVNLASMVIELPAMHYSIPGSKGSGSVVVSNLNNPVPTVKLVIETDKFDATPWMGSAPDQSSIKSLTMEQMLFSLVSINLAYAQVKSGPVDIPVETIRQLDVDARLSIGTFILDTLQATDVKAELRAKNGIARIEPFSAQLFGGNITGMMELDATTATPKFRVTENLNGVQIAQVMKYSMGEDSKEWITGVANMSAKLRTQGPDSSVLTQALNGTVDARVKDGAFEGFSVRKMLQRANALLKRENYVDDGSPDRTKILEMSLKTKLVNGVAITDSIKVLTPLADLTGSGSANLNTQQLDYRLKLALSSGISEIDKAEFKKLEGKALPLKITGNFNDPKFKIDMSKAAKQEVKQKAEKKIRKKFGKKYGKQLDLLFGR
ncbi:putative assembly protein [bacterium BMS3Bbin11]|nr:putative assembly protein [bacterium BMS3Abin11]GBE45970.1 putative assembly protein [bacterium BMS3Bbin11]HDH14980.1 AsmA family protein [Gammaproteobacteria bacterium]